LKKTAVVILNYNGSKFLKRFLPGVVEKSLHVADIIVADNNSTDDSIELLENEFPQVKLIKLAENKGYAGGYNNALKQVNADYYILLNSDIEVTDGWIESVIDLMDSDENIAACQPKILSWHDKTRFEYAGAAGGYIDKYGYPFCRGRIFQSIEEDKGQYDDVKEVFWASGACMFVRSDVFHQLGGFDEDFFAHMEEIDFCWRAKNSGYKIMVQPSSVVYHIGGGTLPKSSARKTYLNFRNNFSLLYKNIEQKRLFMTFLFRLILDGVAGIKFLLEGHPADTWSVIKAHFYFYKNFGKLNKKRKQLKHNKISCIYKGNVVIEHYILHKTVFSELNPEKFT
jgi:GT2 family glycosyltransferase